METGLDNGVTLQAQYSDGQSARIEDVRVMVHAGVQRGQGDLVVVLPDGRRVTWQIAQMRALRDQGHAGVMTLIPEPGADARLWVRDPGVQAILRNAAPELGSYRADAGVLKRIALWSGGAVAAILLIVFVLVPAISDQLAPLIPPEAERKLGEATIDQLKWVFAKVGAGDIRECENPAGRVALGRMQARLSAEFETPYAINLRVVDHRMPNAFAVPGGQIVIFDGLLKKATSPEEVAGVLGHEMGHVVNRDPTRLALRSTGTVGILGLLVGDFTGGTALLLVSERLIAASYAQDAEAAADEFAVRVLGDAGLPSTPFGNFFDRMADIVGDGNGLLSHLASHPNIRERAEAARDADRVGDGDFKPVLSAADWKALQAICDAPAAGGEKNTRD